MNDYEAYISKVHDLPPQENTQPQGNPDFELEPTAPLNEEQLKKDPDFIANSWAWFNATKESDKSSLSPYSSLKYHGVTTDEQVAEWGIGQASAFNNNLSKMGVDFMKMRKRPIGELKAMLGVIDAYSQTDTTLSQGARGVAQMALDPLSWGGFSVVGKAIVKDMGSNSVRRYMRSILAQKMQNPVVTGAAVGASYSGAAGAMDEDLRSTAQQRSYNPIVPMIYAVTGAGLGGALGATPYAVKGIYQKFKGWRGGGDGATLTDSKAVATSFGDIQEKTIEAQNPVFFGETTTIDEFADHLDLDEAQTAQLSESIGAGRRDTLDTATLMQEADIQEALRYRGVDAVGYPEKAKKDYIINAYSDMLKGSHKYLDKKSALPESPDLKNTKLAEPVLPSYPSPPKTRTSENKTSMLEMGYPTTPDTSNMYPYSSLIKEIESPDISLDNQGVYMTIREVKQ